VSLVLFLKSEQNPSNNTKINLELICTQANMWIYRRISRQKDAGSREGAEL
jgi:hypothetical protein